ncbi:unnamed protein product [Closterium sp. NIES-65]|nr:unnamed protein product [Closterium sp. NIES-65]
MKKGIHPALQWLSLVTPQGRLVRVLSAQVFKSDRPFYIRDPGKKAETEGQIAKFNKRRQVDGSRHVSMRRNDVSAWRPANEFTSCCEEGDRAGRGGTHESGADSYRGDAWCNGVGVGGKEGDEGHMSGRAREGETAFEARQEWQQCAWRHQDGYSALPSLPPPHSYGETAFEAPLEQQEYASVATSSEGSAAGPQGCAWQTQQQGYSALPLHSQPDFERSYGKTETAFEGSQQQQEHSSWQQQGGYSALSTHSQPDFERSYGKTETAFEAPREQQQQRASGGTSFDTVESADGGGAPMAALHVAELSSSLHRHPEGWDAALMRTLEADPLGVHGGGMISAGVDGGGMNGAWVNCAGLNGAGMHGGGVDGGGMNGGCMQGASPPHTSPAELLSCASTSCLLHLRSLSPTPTPTHPSHPGLSLLPPPVVPPLSLTTSTAPAPAPLTPPLPCCPAATCPTHTPSHSVRSHSAPPVAPSHHASHNAWDMGDLKALHEATFPIAYESEFYSNVVHHRGIISWGAVDPCQPDRLVGFLTARLVPPAEAQRDWLVGFITARLVPAAEAQPDQLVGFITARLVPPVGAQAAWGAAWVGAAWVGAAWVGAAWVGAAWVGAAWVDAAWVGAAWVGAAWVGAAWVGAAWVGAAWVGAAWVGAAWVGAAWVGAAWVGAAWVGAAWVGAAWVGATWVGAAWVGAAWVGAAWVGAASAVSAVSTNTYITLSLSRHAFTSHTRFSHPHGLTLRGRTCCLWPPFHLVPPLFPLVPQHPTWCICFSPMPPPSRTVPPSTCTWSHTTPLLSQQLFSPHPCPPNPCPSSCHPPVPTASHLVHLLLSHASSLPHCAAVYLHVVAYNAAAIRFYRSLRFCFRRRLSPFYYLEGGEYDALLFARYVNGWSPPDSRSQLQGPTLQQLQPAFTAASAAVTAAMSLVSFRPPASLLRAAMHSAWICKCLEFFRSTFFSRDASRLA